MVGEAAIARCFFRSRSIRCSSGEFLQGELLVGVYCAIDYVVNRSSDSPEFEGPPSPYKHLVINTLGHVTSSDSSAVRYYP